MYTLVIKAFKLDDFLKHNMVPIGGKKGGGGPGRGVGERLGVRSESLIPVCPYPFIPLSVSSCCCFLLTHTLQCG